LAAELAEHIGEGLFEHHAGETSMPHMLEDRLEE